MSTVTRADSDTQREPSNGLEDTARPSKKARLEVEDIHRVSTSTIQESHISKLPLEILSEILILTGSPRHVLAFARTSKHFCYVLLGEGAQHVWRRARRGPQCRIVRLVLDSDVPKIVSLPDPPKGIFSEAAYAAFLFDPGTCDNCGKKTFVPYASFALRIRFCHELLCRHLPVGIQDPGRFKEIVPTNETSDITVRSETGVLYWPFPSSPGRTFSRKIDIDKAKQESQSETGETTLESRRRRNMEWMQFCSSLAKWQATFDQEYSLVRQSNEVLARRFAVMFGWKYTEMMECAVFSTFFNKKSWFLETVYIQDASPLHEQIESSLLALREKRQRRQAGISLMQNRKDIEVLYDKIRSDKSHDYLPSLPTFRQLPVTQLLQAGVYDGEKISDTLQVVPLMRQRLDQDIQGWIESAKQDLAVVLGFPKQWKSANKKVLHPVERSTAWFLCKNCRVDGIGDKTDGSLDFAGACLHVCRGGKSRRSRRSKKAAWNPEVFIKDEKAINAMKSALSKMNLSDETVDGFNLRRSSVAVVCNSCEPSMLLDSRNIIGHCHRHNSMEVTIASPDQLSYLNGFAYSYGLVTKFFRPSRNTYQSEIAKKNFGCRICLRRQQVKDTIDNRIEANFPPTINLPDVAPGQKPDEMPTLFSFNGMRSHLKAKHGIENIKDEDFFCAEAV